MRTPNSKECLHHGLGLYDRPTHIGSQCSHHKKTIETRIGSFEANEIDDEDGTHLEGRIDLTVDVDGTFIWLDLEDILVFAKKYCSAMYWRIDANTESVSN